MSIFSAADFDNHERVVFCRDEASQLNAIIALHNTALGPAAGGCRMWPYKNEQEALCDALRLSRGMSYKNAMAGLPLGGGKAVIIGDPQTDKSEKLLQSFGTAVEQLHGDYITAEDVGMTVSDMAVISGRTQYVSGLPIDSRKAGGDPSPKTAYGVYLGILAAVAFRTREKQCADLKGVRIAVQGLGGVGYNLCRLLHQAGAALIVSDINQERLLRARDEFHAETKSPEEILFQQVDVLSPCAMGAILNRETIPLLNTPIVAGAANNQLATEIDGVHLMAEGILYAPDYVINAGGIINVAYEFFGLGTEQNVMEQIEKIGPRLADIFEQSATSGKATNIIANTIAHERLAQAKLHNKRAA